MGRWGAARTALMQSYPISVQIWLTSSRTLFEVGVGGGTNYTFRAQHYTFLGNPEFPDFRVLRNCFLFGGGFGRHRSFGREFWETSFIWARWTVRMA